MNSAGAQRGWVFVAASASIPPVKRRSSGAVFAASLNLNWKVLFVPQQPYYVWYCSSKKKGQRIWLVNLQLQVIYELIGVNLFLGLEVPLACPHTQLKSLCIATEKSIDSIYWVASLPFSDICKAS
ncbi:hypothetical protein Pelo_7227 [Pelomyxa schiedti]|nr:hypothetical protein Pelo_7227 [Pelomyxa schiedti]